MAASRARDTVAASEAARSPGTGPLQIGTPVMRRKAMAAAERKEFRTPDETRSFEKGRLDLLQIGGSSIGRLTLEPGWRWSQHVKPLAGTAWCEAPHFQYHVAGTLRIQMADGT